MGAVFRTPRLRDPRVVPTEDVEIDWSHPLADGAVAVFVPGSASGFVDLCGNGALTAGTGSFAQTNEGVGFETNVLADAATGAIVPAWNLLRPSLSWRGTVLGTSGSGGLPWIFGSDNAADNNRSWMFYNAGNTNYWFFAYGAGSYLQGVGKYPASLTASVSVGFGYDWAGNVTEFVDGVQGSSAAEATSLPTANNLLYLGGGSGVITEIATLYNKPTTQVDWAWLDAEPFAMLRPKMRRRYYIPSTGATTLSPAAGALALLGSSPGVEIGRTVAPGLGTIDLSGLTPVAEIGVTVAPGKGSLAISGDTPVVEIGTTVAPAHGMIALAGEMPAVEIGVTEAPAAGVLALQGQTPTVSTGATPLTVSPGAGTLDIAGGAVAADIGVTVAPGKGALALDGQTPVAEVGVIATPSAGALDIAGVAPTVTVGVEVAPSAGLLALEGATPLVLRGVTTAPAEGSIAVMGGVPMVVIGGLMIPTEIVVFAAPLDSVAFSAPTDRVQFATPTDTVVF